MSPPPVTASPSGATKNSNCCCCCWPWTPTPAAAAAASDVDGSDGAVMAPAPDADPGGAAAAAAPPAPPPPLPTATVAPGFERRPPLPLPLGGRGCGGVPSVMPPPLLGPVKPCPGPPPWVGVPAACASPLAALPDREVALELGPPTRPLAECDSGGYTCSMHTVGMPTAGVDMAPMAAAKDPEPDADAGPPPTCPGVVDVATPDPDATLPAGSC